MTAEVQKPAEITESHRRIAADVQHAMVMSSAVYHERIVAQAIADAEKRAAAKALRDLADDPAASTITHTANFGLPARVVPVATIYARAAALDPAGADSGEGR